MGSDVAAVESNAATRRSELREVVRVPDLRRLAVAWCMFYLVDGVTLVAVSGWAFEAGGARSVGAVGMARLLPGAVATPIGAWAADRFPRRRVVMLAFAAMTVTHGLLLVALAWDAAALLVYVVLGAGSVAVQVYRPAHLSLTPLVVASPGQLVAVNVVSGVLEGFAVFVGPAAAGLVLLWAAPSAAVGIAFVAALVGFLAVSSLRVEIDPSKAVRRVAVSPWRAIAAGFVELRRNGAAAVVVSCFIVQLMVRGLLNVLLVAYAFDVLGLDESGVGWLAAAMGVGGIVGGVAAGTLAGRRRLAQPFALALVLWGAPIAVLAGAEHVVAALAAMLVVGVGNALLDVAGFTLIQRAAPDRSLARVFGVLFSVAAASCALGSALAPVLLDAMGLGSTLVLTGAVLPVLAAVLLRRFRRLDRESEPPIELVELLRGTPLLGPLPPTMLEKLAVRCGRLTFDDGEVVVHQGDPGDRFFIVQSGSVRVIRDGIDRGTLEAGAHFGEVALVRDTTRAATVIAEQGAVVVSLAHDDFLDALSSSDAAYGFAWQLTGRLLGDRPA